MGKDVWSMYWQAIADKSPASFCFKRVKGHATNEHVALGVMLGGFGTHWGAGEGDVLGSNMGTEKHIFVMKSFPVISISLGRFVFE